MQMWKVIFFDKDQETMKAETRMKIICRALFRKACDCRLVQQLHLPLTSCTEEQVFNVNRSTGGRIRFYNESEVGGDKIPREYNLRGFRGKLTLDLPNKEISMNIRSKRTSVDS